MTRDRRVLVTGIGAVSAAGANTGELWQRLRTGTSGIVELPPEIAEGAGVAVGGIASSVGAEQVGRGQSRIQALHLLAVTEAVGTRLQQVRGKDVRVGLYFGTSLGGAPELLWRSTKFGVSALKDRTAPVKYLNHTPASLAAERLGIHGPCVSFGSACSASTDAILAAATAIRTGTVDIAIASGAEAWLYPTALMMFGRMGALSKAKGADACRPFDTDRDGAVAGEGAGALVLEAAPTGRPYAEFLGGASSCDAYHPVRPDPSGAALERAYELALADAGVGRSDVDYINCHATATPTGDLVEAEVANRFFGGRPPPMSSSKGVLGHTLGACGALESIGTVLAVREGFLPPTANLRFQDPRCDIDAVPVGRPARISVALKSNSGFGGENTVLVFGEV